VDVAELIFYRKGRCEAKNSHRRERKKLTAKAQGTQCEEQLSIINKSFLRRRESIRKRAAVFMDPRLRWDD
jgi:hypothetical protein